MNCGGCGFEVSSDFAFCPKCGAKVDRACPSCGFACPAEFAFCPKCGTSVDAAAPVAAPAPKAEPVAEGRHFYSTPGDYVVTLTVRDYAGQEDSASRQVTGRPERPLYLAPPARPTSFR